MGLVQSRNSAGVITIEASSRGLAPATLTIKTKSVTVRPQIPVWERKIPQGSGASGLWRPDRNSSAEIIVLSQDGGKLTGSAEGFGGSWAGGNDSPTPVEDGSVEGNKVSFRIAGITYSGTLDGDRMELARSVAANQRLRPDPLEVADKSLAIGPAPDGSDPSRGPLTRPQPIQPFILRRVNR